MAKVDERFIDRFRGDPRGFVLRWMLSWARWSAVLVGLMGLYALAWIVTDEFHEKLPRFPKSAAILILCSLVVSLLRESSHILVVMGDELLVRKAGGSIRRYRLTEIQVHVEQIQPQIHRISVRSATTRSRKVFYLRPPDAGRLVAALSASSRPDANPGISVTTRDHVDR